ncbi:MAG: hypothetical protein U0350_36505 [Caldilineaceae bacterium]
MEIQIKITNLEISIDTDEPTPAPAVVDTLAKALQAAPPPLPLVTEQPKVRKGRTVEAAPKQSKAAAPAMVIEPQTTGRAALGDAEKSPNGHDADAASAPKLQPMDFHEFDSLVRAEIARLAPERRPSHDRQTSHLSSLYNRMCDADKRTTHGPTRMTAHNHRVSACAAVYAAKIRVEGDGQS